MTTTLISKQQKSFTLEEYRSQEETAEFRSEYRDGEIVPMTGGTINHNRITRNICTLLQGASQFCRNSLSVKLAISY